MVAPTGTAHVSLADRLLTFDLPPGAVFDSDFYADGQVRLADGGIVGVDVNSFEEPGIDAATFARIHFGPIGDLPDDFSAPPVGTVADFVRTDPETGYSERVWRVAHILAPDRFRLASWFVPAPVAETTAAAAEAMARSAVLRDEAMPWDRVAPSRTLRRVHPWDMIVMRVPRDWPGKWRENSNRWVFDDAAGEFATLWVDHDILLSGLQRPESGALPDIHDVIRERRPEGVKVGDIDGDRMFLHTYTGVENGEALRFWQWHRFALRGGTLILAHFSLVLVEAFRGTPEYQEAYATVEREVGNAVILEPHWIDDP